MRDRNLQRGAHRRCRTGLECRGARVGSRGAVITRRGIDHRICHPTRQQNQPLPTPRHRVVNRQSFTSMVFPTVNSLTYVPVRPVLAKGRNRPSFPPRPSWARLSKRPANNESHGGDSARLVYPDGIDRVNLSTTAHGIGRNSLLCQSNTPCWRARKEGTPRQSSGKRAKCRAEDNIGSPNPHEDQFLPKVDSWKCRYLSANLRGSDSWPAPSRVRMEGDHAHRL